MIPRPFSFARHIDFHHPFAPCARGFLFNSCFTNRDPGLRPSRAWVSRRNGPQNATLGTVNGGGFSSVPRKGYGISITCDAGDAGEGSSRF